MVSPPLSEKENEWAACGRYGDARFGARLAISWCVALVSGCVVSLLKPYATTRWEWREIFSQQTRRVPVVISIDSSSPASSRYLRLFSLQMSQGPKQYASIRTN